MSGPIFWQELHSYIEKGLGKNLKARCSPPLIESIEEYKTEMQGMRNLTLRYILKILVNFFNCYFFLYSDKLVN